MNTKPNKKQYSAVQKEYFKSSIMILSESSYFSDNKYLSDSDFDETFKELDEGRSVQDKILRVSGDN